MSIQACPGIINERLSQEAFASLCGRLAGVPYLKVVVERESGRVHFINANCYRFHSDYIAEQILKTDRKDLDESLDAFNEEVYHSPERRFLLATLGLQQGRAKSRFLTLETVEIDSMNGPMIRELFDAITPFVERHQRLFFKPNNH